MELKESIKTKKSKKDFSFINRRTVDIIQEVLAGTIYIGIYHNDVGKAPRIHVWDGDDPNEPISFHVQIGIISLPDKIEVLKVQYGKLPDEIITTLSKWVYSNANPRFFIKSDLANWQFILLCWDCENEKNTIKKHLEKCTFSIREFFNNSI